MKKPNSGQATLELAIFGALSLTIVGAMLSYGLTLTTQQQLDAYAFRRALQFSRARYNDNKACREASFTVLKEIYPPLLTGSGIQKQEVGGSASVNWETDAGTLDGKDPDDFGHQYYQWGLQMIKGSQAIDLPRMVVKRDKTKAQPRGFIGYVIDLMHGPGGTDGEDSKNPDGTLYMAAPIEQTASDVQKDNVAIERTTESGGIVHSYQNIRFTEDSGKKLVMESAAKIMKVDPKIHSASVPDDILILQKGTVDTTRDWTSPAKR